MTFTEAEATGIESDPTVVVRSDVCGRLSYTRVRLVFGIGRAGPMVRDRVAKTCHGKLLASSGGHDSAPTSGTH
ncbi:hypothetical protein AB0465_21345 [Streptomyces griseoviridis]|uniref:hypothetical protein n=1 Tax=Streptomyces griseoviridis TaxID=45398 RepID=UPI00344E09EA